MAIGPRFKTKKRLKSEPDPVSVGEPWLEKYCPQSLDQLAMHKAKITELERVFQSESTAVKLLIVSGPAGSSKSTAIRLLCKSHGRDIIEWSSPESSIGDTHLSDAFGDFLVGAALQNRSKVILIDELPNLYHDETRQYFRDAIYYWLKQNIVPLLVISLTEIDNTPTYSEMLTVERVFGPIVDRESVRLIKTNPVNVTELKKALKRIAAGETMTSKATTQAIDILAQSGDIRHAITTFEFWCRGIEPGDSAPQIRDTHSNLFHSLGVVIYGSKHGYEVESLLDEMYTDSNSFNLNLLENYLKAHHQQMAITAAADCAEWLSFADQGNFDRGLEPLASLGIAHAIQVAAKDPTQPRQFAALRGSEDRKHMKVMTQVIEDIKETTASIRSTGAAIDFNATKLQLSFGFKPNVADDWFDSSDSDF